ncbi:MAG: hypothetical protein GKR89_01275 [Candidatus Latescibacteria bacterium]|nr:hypothetical protein [Candidatus Latescibacterota bacterium]
MPTSIEQWLHSSRAKLRRDAFSDTDLQELENLLSAPVQQVLYLYSKSTNMRSPLAGWNLYDPTQPHQPTLPSQEPPYPSVIAALADGWRIVQFPVPQLHRFSDIDNDYLGFEFILEKIV